MDCFVKRTWAAIDLDNLGYNFRQIRKKVGNKTKVMCVVKADAYGHGASYAAAEFERQGADWFAVSNIEEAMQLRFYGINKPILILGYTPDDMVEKLCNFNISQAILSYDYAVKLSKACKGKGVKIKGHIKLDTGMNRIGFPCQSKEEICASIDLISKIADIDEIKLEGIFTHFSVADSDGGREYTEFQFRNFKLATDKLEEKGIHIPIKHCCNSGGIMSYPEMKLGMVRAGVILYGLPPSGDFKGRMELRPAMELKTVISQIKKIKKGRTVSYGRTFTAEDDIVIATVPIGYADGYSRGFSGKACMLVNGKKAPILGRVCMDQLMLDVTDIKDVTEGTEVVVFGSQDGENISVDELADIIGTINYEVVCLIGKRVPRIYYREGKNIGKFSYI